MKRIIRDFYVAEARGVLPLLLLIQLLMCGLAYYAGFSYVYMLFIPVLAVVAFLRAVYEGQRFREAFEALPLLRQERIAKEYNAPHSCVQLYLGEAHLLSDCLVCRSRRTLRLFPAETLVQANIQAGAAFPWLDGGAEGSCRSGTECFTIWPEADCEAC